jgi:hypothetical protein
MSLAEQIQDFLDEGIIEESYSVMEGSKYDGTIIFYEGTGEEYLSILRREFPNVSFTIKRGVGIEFAKGKATPSSSRIPYGSRNPFGGGWN